MEAARVVETNSSLARRTRVDPERRIRRPSHSLDPIAQAARDAAKLMQASRQQEATPLVSSFRSSSSRASSRSSSPRASSTGYREGGMMDWLDRRDESPHRGRARSRFESLDEGSSLDRIDRLVQRSIKLSQDIERDLDSSFPRQCSVRRIRHGSSISPSQLCETETEDPSHQLHIYDVDHSNVLSSTGTNSVRLSTSSLLMTNNRERRRRLENVDINDEKEIGKLRPWEKEYVLQKAIAEAPTEEYFYPDGKQVPHPKLSSSKRVEMNIIVNSYHWKVVSSQRHFMTKTPLRSLSTDPLDQFQVQHSSDYSDEIKNMNDTDSYSDCHSSLQHSAKKVSKKENIRLSLPLVKPGSPAHHRLQKREQLTSTRFEDRLYPFSKKNLQKK